MELEKIKELDPKEYGLQEVQVHEIQAAFVPKIQEHQALSTMHDWLIKQEITPKVAKEAGDVRRKLKKVRTGIAAVHKTQKAFFLAGGRYVDAYKNKASLPIQQMEENLMEIEKYQERIEQERLRKLQEQRVEEVKGFVPDAASRDLSSMDVDVWEAFVAAAQKKHQERLAAEAEAKRIAEEKEKQRKAAEEQRQKELAQAKKERDAAIKARKEAEAKELKARKEAEAKARKERDEIEAKAKKEREEMEARLKAAEKKAAMSMTPEQATALEETRQENKAMIDSVSDREKMDMYCAALQEISDAFEFKDDKFAEVKVYADKHIEKLIKWIAGKDL